MGMQELILRWTKDTDDDAEYNQSFAMTAKGTKLTVFSDLDEEDWGYQVGDGDMQFGHDTQFEARYEAESDARDQGV